MEALQCCLNEINREAFNMEEFSEVSTGPSVVSPLGSKMGHKSSKRSLEGLRMYEATSSRKQISQQILSIQNRLARLARDKAEVEKAIQSTALRAETILQRRRRLEAKRKEKQKRLEAQREEVISKRDRAHLQREFHKSSMSDIIANLRASNFKLADAERRRSVERRLELEKFLKAERDRKKQSYLHMSATQQSFRDLSKKQHLEHQTKLIHDYSNRIVGEQTMITDLKGTLSELEKLEQALLEQLSSTQQLRSKEVSTLQLIEENRDLKSRTQLISVLEDTKLA
mmetsp:Transcript_26156/g.46528  ORF Transcript_26156/g.46528 Transcript_26156/m.46528 type:complete len:285 (+) Transcript_26156:7099-7953(+)